MEYTALYRKLRPGLFSGVIGQNHIVKTLKNQLLQQRISHAYLFCGTRGTGKTSSAKIFAKAINCLNPQDGDPCGVCQSCVEISGQTSMNVIEIDAASNNGVDNIRDIREEVKYPPVNGKYKVYIIDEVHMLSTGAFNALLKTLEEPPAHVVFILATTDPQKVPVTVLSRCQRFDFHRISSTDITNQLKQYMESEKIAVDENALRYIAKISDGAMRDALSILDQCISFYYGESITLEKVQETTGSVDNAVFFALTDALYASDTSACIHIIDDIIMKGRDISQFVTELIVHLRNVLIMATAPKAENAIGFSDDTTCLLQDQCKKLEPSVIISYVNAFSQLQGKLRYASNDRILLEICCIQICNSINEAPYYQVPPAKNMDTLKKAEPEKSTDKPKAIPEDFKAVLARWDEFASSFRGMEGGFLKNTKAGYLENDYLYIVCDSISSVSILKKKEELISQKLTELYKKIFELNFVFKDIYEEMHKKQYGIPDDFHYTDAGQIEEIKNSIAMDIKVE